MTQPLVFLGDSITDGHSLILHVEQALAARGTPRACFNCGIGGDRADQMLARLGRDVIPLLPATVCVSAGINDAMQGVPAEDYRIHMTALVGQLIHGGAQVVLLTPTLLDARHQAAVALVQAYRDVVFTLARGANLRVADVGASQAAAHAAAQSTTKSGASGEMIAPDGIHLEEPGYVVMATTVLQALGATVPTLPPRPRWEPLPGLITDWQITCEDSPSEPLAWTVPEEPCAAPWWEDQERARGFARAFISRLPGTRWRAEAILPAGPAGLLALGGHVTHALIDDLSVLEDGSWRGWHVKPGGVVPASTRPRRLRLHITGPFVAAFGPH